jgi:Cu+-exporting ATPase
MMQTTFQAPGPGPRPASHRRSEIAVAGMTCNGCARHVTEAIQSVPGVQSAAVSLQDRNAIVRWNAGTTSDITAVIHAIEGAGFKAKAIDPEPDNATLGKPARRESIWSNSVFIGVIPTALLIMGEWALGLSHTTWFRWASFALASFVQFGPGLQFYRGAWNQMKVGQSNMDTLVSLGSTTAFSYSMWALLSGHSGHLYFMEAAAIITLISVGHWIEARVSSRAANSLKALMHLAPTTARRIDARGGEQEVPIGELNPGDVVVLKAGDRIPTDGEVTQGTSVVDESMLTGESMPVEKTPGATLYAGTANQSSRILMRVTSTGEETALSQIIAAVQRAQSSRANIQRLGDRVSNVFVPIVVLIAIASALWWGLFPEHARQLTSLLSAYLWTPHVPDTALAAALVTAAAVLIIACPCAMGLATPAAIMAGANAAARRGILIRDGVAIEKAGTITAIAFDKTGTLTEGRPKVVAQQTFPNEFLADLAVAQAEALAASLGAMSNHPLSKAIADHYAARLKIDSFTEHSGRGVSALFQSHRVQLGALRWLAEEGTPVECAAAFADEWMSRGSSIVGVSVHRRLIAVFALRDTLKPGARELIQRLGKTSGPGDLGIYIVSGDTEKTVRAIADELELSRCTRTGVFAGVRPEQKASLVKELQQRGERVAFVGDGINDAPALEQADLGIAVSRASDVAREAADIILLRSEIDAIPESLGIARATLRTIKQNLFWAFFYNALGIPLAALGFMSPVLCAAAMGVSDLVVIGNALRLLRWKQKHLR